MKRLLTILVVAAALSVSYHATAATIFNFAAIADGDTSYGIAAGEYGASSMTFTKDGFELTATGTGYVPTHHGLKLKDTYAYLDSGIAGLGVCAKLQNGQCKKASDDNVTSGETLKLVFDETTTINSITFSNGNHSSSFAGDFELSINGGDWTTYALTNSFTMDGLTGTTFEFYNPNFPEALPIFSNDYQFYISDLTVASRGFGCEASGTCAPAVPVPAAAWLFGSGLIGLVGVARRKAV